MAMKRNVVPAANRGHAEDAAAAAARATDGAAAIDPAFDEAFQHCLMAKLEDPTFMAFLAEQLGPHLSGAVGTPRSASGTPGKRGRKPIHDVDPDLERRNACARQYIAGVMDEKTVRDMIISLFSLSVILCHFHTSCFQYMPARVDFNLAVHHADPDGSNFDKIMSKAREYARTSRANLAARVRAACQATYPRDHEQVRCDFNDRRMFIAAVVSTQLILCPGAARVGKRRCLPLGPEQRALLQPRTSSDI